MKKLLLLQAVFALSILPLFHLQGQSDDYLAKAYAYLSSEYGLDQKALGALKIDYQYRTDHNQVEHVHFVQVYNDLKIFGTHFNLAVQPNGKVSASGHQLMVIDPYPSITHVPAISPAEAIGVVAGELGIQSRAATTITRHTAAGLPVYSKVDISLQDIPVETGYLHLKDGSFHLTYKTSIESVKSGLLYQSFVDALSGELLAHDQMTLRCQFDDHYLSHEHSCDQPVTLSAPVAAPPAGALSSYRVLPLSVESPNHGSFELVSDPNDPIASPFGWHDTNGAAGHEFTNTRGNNVHAFLDRNWDYASDGNVDGGASLLFDFGYDGNLEPAGNQNIAITNLFYWNNIMHDFTYRYGFNEVAGNFQTTNLTGMGGDNDHVNAHGQFGDDNPIQCGDDVNGGTDCLNNADFSTPTDGFNGRMRMFTWDRDNSSKFLDVLQPIELAGKILTGTAQFGEDITTTPVTGTVIIADDGSTNPSHACQTLAGQPDVAGAIVLIDRGLCDFSEKVYHAQLGGAIGAIICNFEEAVIDMGAANNAELVTIPSVFISHGDCQRIRVAAAEGLTVSLVAPVGEGGPSRRDGSLDNSIIAHEYGHGISTRLTGGPSNSGCLNPGATTGDAEEASGMGEGWSDFFGLVTTVKAGDTGDKKRGIGTYANKESIDGRGIRTFPYSTDMNINSHTYDDILFESVPHGVGSVWAAMLWDLYWAFVDAYGFDEDLYSGTGGNNIAIQLVIDGLKMQKCNPGFIHARDAILQADQINNNGVNECLIWNVFARRGLGWDADGGDENSRADGIEGFSPLPTCVKELKLTKRMTPEALAGDQIEVTLYAVNHTDATLTNVTLEDPIPSGTSYVPGSANIDPVLGNSLVWILNDVDPGEEINITYTLQTAQDKNSIRVHYDDIEGDGLERWNPTFDPDKSLDNIWAQDQALARSGSHSWYVADIVDESEQYLENFEPYEITGNYPVYRFYHYYDTETGADGGFLEISTNSGHSWVPLGDKVFRNGYPRRLQYTTFAIPNLYAYSGLSSPNLEWTPVYADLRDYIGEEVLIRYRFGTDDNTPGDGWYVDDVEIMDAVVYNSTACISSDQTDMVCTEAPERGTIIDSEITIGTEDHQDNASYQIYPNPAADLLQLMIDASTNDKGLIRIYDIAGKPVMQSAWNLVAGNNEKTVDVSALPSGIYVVQTESAEGIFARKFIKE